MKMTVTKRLRFEAAHFLEGYDGKCANIHGHSYVVDLTFEGPGFAEGQQREMVIDLTKVRELAVIVDVLDHCLLIESLHGRPPGWPEEPVNPSTRILEMGCRPTAENIASLIAHEVAFELDSLEEFKDSGVRLVKVRLQETDTSWVELENSLGLWASDIGDQPYGRAWLRR